MGRRSFCRGPISRWLKPISGGQAASERNRANITEEEAGEAQFAWTIFLFASHPRKGAFALMIVLFTTWFTWDFSGSTWMAAIAGFVLIASLSNFFFPTRFRLDDETVHMGNIFYRRTRRWAEFRSLSRQGKRIKLLTLPSASRLDNFRGMLLILPENEEGIVEYIQAHLRGGTDGTA